MQLTELKRHIKKIRKECKGDSPYEFPERIEQFMSELPDITWAQFNYANEVIEDYENEQKEKGDYTAMRVFRMKLIKRYGDVYTREMIKYMEDHNILIDYLTNEEYGNPNGGKEREDAVHNMSQAKLKTMKKIKKDGEVYYIDKNRTICYVYKLLPSVYDDKNFEWKQDIKNKVKVCTITKGNFEFFIRYFNSGNATVDVKYTKLDNRHRNRITIADFEIENATNESLMESIQLWREKFISDLAAV